MFRIVKVIQKLDGVFRNAIKYFRLLIKYFEIRYGILKVD